jgi:hypothetical protein
LLATLPPDDLEAELSRLLRLTALALRVVEAILEGRPAECRRSR